MAETPRLDMALVDRPLAQVLERLLAKNPKARYASVNEVIVALSRAAGQPPPVETELIRESFLQAAQFVGRETELAQLTAAFREAAARGRGSAWLVGGESGVGKSRLLDQVRTRTLVRGALVLRGQAVSAGGGLYQLWRQSVRWLALLAELSELEAAVLKAIVPDMEALLGRETLDAPELPPQAAQDRLRKGVATLFRRHSARQPIVLLLEDLQWADDNSLELLRRLNRQVAGRPVLVVGSFRDDESSHLPQTLPGMQLLKLERLPAERIAELSAAMLGPAGRQPRVVAFLQRETEGNVFFLIEVVRALAEEAGRLDQIGRQSVPGRVFTGGLRQMVQRRLDRVPLQDRPLLQLAAVAGRQLDLEVLRAAAPEVDLERWLAACADAAVLQVHEDCWRFTHDKLREGVLLELPPEARRSLHQRAAQAIESANGPDLLDQAAALALHWELAGEGNLAAGWYGRAGDQARTAYAPEAAIGCYQKALALAPLRPAWQLGTYEGLGEMLRWQARYAEAAQTYRAMQAMAQTARDAAAQVRAWRGLGGVQDSQGDHRGALESAEQAEKVARKAGMPEELARAVLGKGVALYRMGDMGAALRLSQEALALSEELDARPVMARSNSLLGTVYSSLGYYQQAVACKERALALYQELDNRRLVGITLNNLGETARRRGDYRTALGFYPQALAIAQEIGDRDWEIVYLGNIGGARVGLGEYDKAESYLRRAIQMAEETGATMFLPEMYRSMAEVALGQGKAAEALPAVRRALALGQELEMQEDVGVTWRVLGMVLGNTGGRMDGRDAAACFAQSLQIFTGMSAEGERARTLRAWARHELGRGDREKGAAIWGQAREIFERLGMEKEVARMSGRLACDRPGQAQDWL